MDRLKWSQETVDEWFRVDGNNTLRLDYQFGPNDIIYDVGAYLGGGALRMSNAWGCEIYSFEPIPEYYEQLKENTADYPNIHVFNFGLGDQSMMGYMDLQGDASTIKEHGQIAIEVMAVDEFMEEHNHNHISLIEINIEGGEYDLLDYMVGQEIVKRFDNITIQFHDVFPDASDRMQSIWTALSKTHELTYQYIFNFENWKRKGIN